MRVHYLQHVEFEGPGAIAEWAVRRGHTLTRVPVFAEGFAHPGDFEMLVVLGGPMNVYQEVECPWLAEEKRFIRYTIDSGVPVLGICLGAQLLADVLGGEVVSGEAPEIGWYPVTLTGAGAESPVFGVLPSRFDAIHWHGDTFTVPPGATRLASSLLTPNQAFEYDGGRVLALQFHLEATYDSWSALCEGAAGGLERGGEWTMSAEEMLAKRALFDVSNEMLFTLLDAMVARGRQRQ